MNENQLKIDPIILERIIRIIDNYVDQQNQVLLNLTLSIKKLSDDWDDEKTFGEMFEYLKSINSKSAETFEFIRDVYKKFYRSEILSIKKVLSTLKV